MFWKSPKRADLTERAKLALELTHDDITGQGEEAVGKALGVYGHEAAPAATLPENPVATLIVLPNPDAHLMLAARAVELMSEEEQQIKSEIAEEELRHQTRNRDLALRLRNVIKTRAFYMAAPDYLAPEVAPATPPKRRVRGSTAKEAERA